MKLCTRQEEARNGELKGYEVRIWLEGLLSAHWTRQRAVARVSFGLPAGNLVTGTSFRAYDPLLSSQTNTTRRRVQ